MQESGVSSPALARELGIKPQALTNLRRKPNGGMRPVLIVAAADFLRCDLRWLCTGEGGDYVAQSTLSRLAREVAGWIDTMSDDDRWKAYGMLMQMRRGYWPTFKDDDAPARRGR